MYSRARHPLACALSVAVAMLVVLAGPAASGADAAPTAKNACQAAGKPAAAISPRRAQRATICILNRVRSRRGRPALRESGGLRAAARGHSSIMVRLGCFAHLCPGQPGLVDRILGTNYLSCDCSARVGENIAYGSGPNSRPRRIVRAWMESPPHRKAMLRPRYRDVGVGITSGTPRDPDDRRGASFTANFGVRG